MHRTVHPARKASRDIEAVLEIQADSTGSEFTNCNACGHDSTIKISEKSGDGLFTIECLRIVCTNIPQSKLEL